MKPLPGDYRHKLLIAGDELRELEKHTHSMAEAFGLDRKIEKYQGTRPITLYRWDLDCLMDMIALALEEETDYRDKSTPEYEALQKLGVRLRKEYDAVYGHEKRPTTRDGKPAVEFSWEGGDGADGTPLTGRGWAVLEGQRGPLRRRIPSGRNMGSKRWTAG